MIVWCRNQGLRFYQGLWKILTLPTRNRPLENQILCICLPASIPHDCKLPSGVLTPTNFHVALAHKLMSSLASAMAPKQRNETV